MMKTICNPLKVKYPYQFVLDPRGEEISIYREAADPSMIFYKGKYYIFASMTLSVWVSEDLTSWESFYLPDELPLYDYAPDVRVIGDWVYFSTSRASENCDFYRTKDILNGPYEKLDGTFPFWDPNLFQDDDGKVYFYWGCSNENPLWGVEVDPETMVPIGEKRALIEGNPFEIGYERIGNDHSLSPRSEEEIDAMVAEFVKGQGIDMSQVPKETIPMIRGMFSQKPFIEGPWMTKHDGKYYLQYACPGTEFNIYGDGVYVGNGPLGPFELAKNNPYSYHPGGFMPGAGHGSTMKDTYGNFWHVSSMSISMNHNFERRVGIWPAGFDEDGELFCNQRYGDWPMHISEGERDPWTAPDTYLLSYKKTVNASSYIEGNEPLCICDENAKTFWQAASDSQKEWIQIDLGKCMEVEFIQLNFADSKIEKIVPGEIKGKDSARYIDKTNMYTHWLLEGSVDGLDYFTIKDNREGQTDYSNDFIELEPKQEIRYIRLCKIQVPYGLNPCISGIRVFGNGHGEKPDRAEFKVKRTGDLNAEVSIKQSAATGFNVLWGHAKDKLYHSYLTYDNKLDIGALVKGQKYYFRVDTFNENGITEGTEIIEA